MKSTKIRNSFLLVLTALIWGSAFVAQSEGGKTVGPYTFNCIRSFVGSLVLLPVIFFLDKTGNGRKPITKEDKRNLLTGGCLCGIVLALATMVQQLGITYGTSSGKAGFLTACYILIVPILGIFLKKKCTFNIWIGVLFALVGLYLLCIKDSFTLEYNDILVLTCAVLFSVHILVVDHFSPRVDGVRLSCIQFFVTGVISFIPMMFVDVAKNPVEWCAAFSTLEAWVPILYAGVFSCGIAYTLQIVGQKGLNPTVASLIMSLESVFAVLAGWVVLRETLSTRELFGCLLIFIAIVLAQIPVKRKA